MDYNQITSVFSESYTNIRKKFPLEYNAMHAVGAVICASAGKSVSREKLNECYTLLKKSKNIFSAFRSFSLIPIVVRMALSDDPQDYLDGLTCVFNEFRKYFSFGTDEVLTASMTIFHNAEKGQYLKTVCDTAEIFEMVHSNHPWLTEKSCLNFSAFMAMCSDDHALLIDDMEQCYNILKKKYRFSFKADEKASQVLSLSPDSPEVKCSRLSEYYDYFKASKVKIDKGQLGILAILMNSGMTKEEAVEGIKKYEVFFKTQKGFGPLSIEPCEKRMMAAALAVTEKFSGENAGISAVAGSVVSMIIDFEIMMLIVFISVSVSVRGAYNQ